MQKWMLNLARFERYWRQHCKLAYIKTRCNWFVKMEKYLQDTARLQPGVQLMKPIGFVTITRDITKEKLLELELQDYTVRLEKIVEERTRKLRISEEKYRRLFETSKDVVFFVILNVIS